MTLKQGLTLAAKVLAKTTDAVNPSGTMTEIAVLELIDDEPKYRYLSTEDIAQLFTEAAKEPAINPDEPMEI